MVLTDIDSEQYLGCFGVFNNEKIHETQTIEDCLAACRTEQAFFGALWVIMFHVQGLLAFYFIFFFLLMCHHKE